MSQTPYQDFKKELDHIFQYLDKSKISSGLLIDYAVELIDLEAFNGIPSDTNYIDRNTFVDLYSTLYDARINNNAKFLPSASEISKMADDCYEQAMNNPEEAIPIYIMLYEYDKIDEDAYKNGHIDIINSIIIRYY